MAVANVAWILASAGKRVLTVDWDLEAPGLHRYFRPFLLDPDLSNSDGIIDFVTDYSTEAMQRLEPVPEETPLPPGRSFHELGAEEQMRIAEAPIPEPVERLKLPPVQNEERLSAEWVRSRADLLYYKSSLDWRFPSGGVLDFVPAGRQTPSYPTRVNSFDWNQFYSKYGGGRLLDALVARLKDQYDYVLIDSRTGVSDTAGICTIQMPDVVVVCFTLNNQSIDGASRITDSMVRQRRSLAEESLKAASRPEGKRGPLIIWPVPMRVDLGEQEKVNRRRKYAREKFDCFLDQVRTELRAEYWGDVEVLYVPAYSFDELLAPFVDLPETKSTVLAACERIANRLTFSEVERLKDPPSSEAREQILKAFQSFEAAPAHIRFEDDPFQKAEAAFQKLSVKQQNEAYRILASLVHVLGSSRFIAQEVNEDELGPDPQVAQILIEAGVLRKWTTQDSGIQVVKYAFANPEYPLKWSRLNAWIASREKALTARQSVVALAREWVSSGRKGAYLLSGEQLSNAELIRNYLAPSSSAVQLVKASKARLWRRQLVWVSSVLGLLLLTLWAAWYVQRRSRAAHILAAANLAPEALQKVLIAQELQGLPEPAAGLATLRQIASQRVPWMVLHSADISLSDGLFLGRTNLPVTSSVDGTIRFWDAQGGELTVYTVERGDYATSIDSTPDGRRLAYAGVIGTAGILEDGVLVAKPATLQSKSALEAIAYSDDGANLAAGDKLGQIRFAGPHEKLSLGTKGAVNSLAWTPDSRYLVSGSDSSIDLFDADAGRKIASIPTGAVSVAVSSDGTQFAAAQMSPLGVGVVTLRSATTLQQEASYPMKEGATSVDFSPSGLLAAADGKVVHVWSKDGSVLNLTGHTAAVKRVRFSADGKLLLAALNDGTAFIWQTQDQDTKQLASLSWSGLLSILTHKTNACLTSSERQSSLGESVTTADTNDAACERSHGREPRSK